MRAALLAEIEAKLEGLNSGKTEGGYLLGGFSFQPACLSCNQQLPRAKPRFPRLLAPPQIRQGDTSGELLELVARPLTRANTERASRT